jgi:hypothetical protein
MPAALRYPVIPDPDQGRINGVCRQAMPFNGSKPFVEPVLPLCPIIKFDMAHYMNQGLTAAGAEICYQNSLICLIKQNYEIAFLRTHML